MEVIATIAMWFTLMSPSPATACVPSMHVESVEQYACNLGYSYDAETGTYEALPFEHDGTTYPEPASDWFYMDEAATQEEK